MLWAVQKGRDECVLELVGKNFVEKVKIENGQVVDRKKGSYNIL